MAGGSSATLLEMASRCWALGCLLVLMLALSCGGVAQRPSPSTESAVAGSSSGGSPGLGGLGAGATSSGGSWPELTTVDPPQAGGPSAPAEFAECRDPRGSSCASHDNYLQIHELRSDGSQVVVQLDWPGGPNCGTCAVFCEDCYFSCELWAQAVQGCGEPNVHVAARNDSNGSVYLDTDSADPHYDDSAGKRWHVLSLIALKTSPSAADAELIDWDLSLTVSDGQVVWTLPVRAHFCASMELVLLPC